ncbi:MAG TPA: hypothetical protein VI390_04560, partial [Methyloceanibacter sp.]
MTGKPIFFDPTGRRGRLLIRLAWAMGVLSGVILALFIASLSHPQAGEFERRWVPASLTVPEDRAVSIGFYASWDDNSYPALKRAPPHLDWIIPSWLSLTGPDMSLKASVDDRVLSMVQATKPNVAILPMIQNGAAGEWDGKGLAKFLTDPTARDGAYRGDRGLPWQIQVPGSDRGLRG